MAGEGSNEEELRVVGPMLETRDFLGTGSDGRGPVGGAIDGRATAGRGSVAMVRCLWRPMGSVCYSCWRSEEGSSLKPLLCGSASPMHSYPRGLLDLADCEQRSEKRSREEVWLRAGLVVPEMCDALSAVVYVGRSGP